MNENTSKKAGPGLMTFTLLWGIVTQCLAWGGVIAWPWYAIWGPFLLNLAIVLAILLIFGITFLIAWIAER